MRMNPHDQQQHHQPHHPLLHHQQQLHTNPTSSRRSHVQSSIRHQHQQQNQHQQQLQQQQQQQLLLQNAHQQQPHTLNGKDLIIRMLAEVFQVNQTSDGQIRWEQVSTSLVPVSLYSRTTSKWLNYLLSSSSSMAARNAASTTTSAMSPDSRDFLLLLQQFHQQNRPPSQQAQHHQQQQNVIVFQVVAHDFLDGHCKKVLNVKLTQPGTRLGQASDYFIYWKEHNIHSSAQHHHSQAQIPPNQMSSSSFASNIQQQQSYTGFSPIISNSNLNPMCCSRSNTIGDSSLQTWGLNFASINDAKLFYDICSLNLVDLDFNSDYLKQLAMKDKNFDMIINPNLQQINLAPQIMLNQRKKQQHHQQQNEQQRNVIRDLFTYKQMHKQQQHFCSTQLPYTNETTNTTKSQPTTSKCPTCKHLTQTKNYAQQSIDNNCNINRFPSTSNNFCPVHSSCQHQDELDEVRQRTKLQQRTRSRSTTRQQKVSVNIEDNPSVKRARSFSTPASPDHKDGPTYNGNSRSIQKSDEQQQHHPRCLSFIKNQQHSSREMVKPQKPVRGVLRDQHLASALSSEFGSPTVATLHMSSVNSSQSLHTNRTPKARYLGHQQIKTKTNTQQSKKIETRQQNPETSNQLAKGYACHPHCSRECSSVENEENIQAQTQPICGYQNLIDNPSRISYNLKQLDFEINKFSNSHSSQRRSTGVESENIDQFDSVNERNARLARAQYANSKNMKEFLSLDGGGTQSTPTQIAALNKRFQQQKKARATENSLTQTADFCYAQKSTGRDFSRKRTSSSESSQKLDANDKPHHLLPVVSRKLTTNKTTTEQKDACDERSNAQNNGDECLVNVVEDDVAARKSVQNNVSTTTDDLPLDALTRKRMFRLTSEEAISEKTEPKSASSLAIEGAQNCYQDGTHQVGTNFSKDRQERAVSLGPDVERAIRGRSARSDTGRRRSLERSMCVDLDSTLPPAGNNTTSNEIYCPSQQTNRIVDLSDKISPTANAQFSRGDVHHTTADIGSECFLDEREKHGHSSSTLKRVRTKSSSAQKSGVHCRSTNSNQFCANTLTSDNDHPESLGLTGHCLQHQMWPNANQLTSFKSAPDVSANYRQFNCNPAQHMNRSQGKDFVSETRNDSAINHHGNKVLNGPITIQQTKTTASHSSYAVPLCSDEGGRQYSTYSRQFHSCPNSLRRKRKISHYSDNSSVRGNIIPSLHDTVEGTCQACFRQCENLDIGNKNLHYHHFPAVCRNVFLPNECKNIEANCSLCTNPVEMNGMGIDGGVIGEFGDFNNKCVGCNFGAAVSSVAPTNFAPVCGSKSCLQLHHQHEQHHSQQHHRLTCMTNVLSGPLMGHDSRSWFPAIDARPECIHSVSTQQHRPYSSQSSRSPLRYGLYESDEEEPQYVPQEDPHPMQRRTAQDLPSYRMTDSYFHGVDSFKPVKGYDQTMARASLRSRQRAKSQPPNEFEVEKDAEHLTQSMRNVQKLITEVQNELNSLKRRPISLIHSSDCTDTKTTPRLCITQPVRNEHSAENQLNHSGAHVHQKSLPHNDVHIKNQGTTSTKAFNLKVSSFYFFYDKS